MSIKIINDVFDNSEMMGNDRLVMLSIADNADDEKRQAWPSVTNISHKTRIPIRTVWRCIKRCVASGELAIVRHGSKDGGSNLYQVTVERSSRVGHKRGSDTLTGVPNGPTPVPMSGIGGMPMSGTLTVIEPSIEPSVQRDRGFIKPSLDSMMEYGQEIGLPKEECEDCFNHYESNGWMVGRSKMSNWKGAMRYWNSNYKKGTYGKTKPFSAPKEGASQMVERMLKGIQ